MSAIRGPGGQSVHERARELAAVAIDFDLDADERAELDAHLMGCGDCRAHVASLASDAMSLAALPSIDAPARVRKGVLAGRPASLWSRAGPSVVALSILLLTIGPLGAAGLYFQGLSSGAGASAAPVVTPGAATGAPTLPPAASPSPAVSPSHPPSPSPGGS